MRKDVWNLVSFQSTCSISPENWQCLNRGFISGRLATVTLKATPAPEKAKIAGAGKGSWGKPGPKAKAAETPVQGGSKVLLSDATTGFKIPVSSTMFDSDRV